tara:strand:- start:447 stop:581 length:135 start_codon:yes stop_codon:yes gene_type:complete
MKKSPNWEQPGRIGRSYNQPVKSRNKKNKPKKKTHSRPVKGFGS